MPKTHIIGPIKLPGWSALPMYCHVQQFTDFNIGVTIIFRFFVYYYFLPNSTKQA